MGRRMTPYLLCKMNNMLPNDNPWTCSCIKLVPYYTSWNKRYISCTIYPPSASCTKMCPPCTTTMYINHVHQQCAKRYHPWNVSTIWQHVHLPICQQCAYINMINKYHLWVYHHASSLAPSKYVNHASTSYDSQWCTTWLSTQLTNYMSQYVFQTHEKCMHHDIQRYHMLPIIHHKIYQWNFNYVPAMYPKIWFYIIE